MEDPKRRGAPACIREGVLFGGDPSEQFAIQKVMGRGAGSRALSSSSLLAPTRLSSRKSHTPELRGY